MSTDAYIFVFLLRSVMSQIKQCYGQMIRQPRCSGQVGPLSQAIRTAACIRFGKNISAKSAHLTSLYPTAIDVDKMMISLFYVTMFVLNAKLCSIYASILEVFGGLNLVSLSVFFLFFVLLKKAGLIFKSPVATMSPTGSLRHVLCTH